MWLIILIIVIVVVFGTQVDWRGEAIAYKEKQIAGDIDKARTNAQAADQQAIVSQNVAATAAAAQAYAEQVRAANQKRLDDAAAEQKRLDALKAQQEADAKTYYDAFMLDEKARVARLTQGLKIFFSPLGVGSLAAFYGNTDANFLKTHVVASLSGPWQWTMQEPVYVFNPNKNSPISVNVQVTFNDVTKFDGILLGNKAMKVSSAGEVTVY